MSYWCYRFLFTFYSSLPCIYPLGWFNFIISLIHTSPAFPILACFISNLDSKQEQTIQSLFLVSFLIQLFLINIAGIIFLTHISLIFSLILPRIQHEVHIPNGLKTNHNLNIFASSFTLLQVSDPTF